MTEEKKPDRIIEKFMVVEEYASKVKEYTIETNNILYTTISGMDTYSDLSVTAPLEEYHNGSSNMIDIGHELQLEKEKELLKDAMRAAYAALQNVSIYNLYIEQAKIMLRVGMMGGSVNNALDVERLNEEWMDRYVRDDS